MKQRGRRLLSVLLSAVMMLTMLPVSVLADDPTVVTATSYEELVTYLNDTSLTQITIAGQNRNAYAGTYEAFSWPEGPVTLNLDKTNANKSCDLYVEGPWTIPSNVTVNVGRRLVLMYAMNGTPSITVDGVWNINDIDGHVHATSPYGGYARALTISESGTLTAVSGGFNGYMAPVTGDAALKLNGSMDLNGHVAQVGSWLLGSDADISSDSVLFLGQDAYLACPEGGAEIECELIAGTDGMQTGTATMGGSFTTKQIMMDQGGELVIEAGSHITTKKLYSSGATYAETLTVNGTLELADRTPLSTGSPVTHLFSDNVTMDIASGGALILRPGNYLSFADEATAAITGSGAVKLYALYDEENGGFSNHPAVFGYVNRQKGEPHQVAETVTISNNWTLNCVHSWNMTPVGVVNGENLYVCTECGTEKLGDSAGGGSGDSGDSGELHVLSAPTNVKWGTFYYAGGTKSFAYPGMIAWTATDTEYEHEYDVHVYKEGETEEVFWGVWNYWFGRNPNMNDHDFSLSVLERCGSGRYYYTVQAKGDGNTTADSEVVTSDVWEYTAPAAKLSAPEERKWGSGIANWGASTESNAGGYSIDVYYSKDLAEATDADLGDMCQTDGFVWYFGEENTNTFYNIAGSMREFGQGYYYFKVKTVSADLNKARHSDYSALSTAYYYDGAEGYQLYYEYDPKLCSINVYDWYDEEMLSIPNGGILPINSEAERAYGVFEITNIAEGYRIGAVYLNGADVTERFVKGSYGGCAMTITEDVVLEVYLEEAPEELPVIIGAEIYTSFAGIWGEEPLTEIEFTEDGQNRLEAKVEYETGSGYPAYYASGLWQYSTDDGATWNDLRNWGTRTDFKADWSGFSNMDIDFVSDSYLLRMKLVPVQHYSVLKNGGPVYSDAIAVNGDPLPVVPAVKDISFSVVGTTNDGITMNWTMETPEEGEPTLDAIDSLEFWMLNSTSSQWEHFYTGFTDESAMRLSEAIAASDLPAGEYTKIRVWSVANGYDENENEVADAKYEQDISLTVTRASGTDGSAAYVRDPHGKEDMVVMEGLTAGLETMLFVRLENRLNSRVFEDIYVAEASGTTHTADAGSMYFLSDEEIAAAWYTLRQTETSVTSSTEADITVTDLSGWKQFGSSTTGEECEHTGVSTSCGIRPICTKCGEYFGEPLDHNWVLDSDFGHHWYKCDRCGTRDGNYEDHVYEEVKDCTVEIRCEVCDYLVRKAKEHEPRGGNPCEDTITCYYCDAVLSEPTGHEWGGYDCSEYSHYRECINCYAWEEGEHVSGNNTDCDEPDICTVCGYVIRSGGEHIPGECTEVNSSWHQVKCADCGEDMYMSSHNYGENASCETGLTCVECGYVKTAPGEHTVPDEYDYSSYQHWKYCSVCYTQLEKADHTIVTDPYVPPTTTTPGKTEGSHCSVCGYVKKAQEEIPVVEEQEVSWLFDAVEWTYGKVGTIYNEAYNDTDGGSELVYSGSNDSVALVDPETGTLTIVGAGTATITATAAAVPGKFMEASASYVLTVNRAPLTVTPNPVDIIYGMAPEHDGYTAEGFVLGEDESVLQGKPVYGFGYQQYDTVGGGEYAITLTGLSAANYEITFAEGILCVEKAEKYTITLDNLRQSAGKTTPVTATIDPQDSTAKISIEYLVNGEWTAVQPETAGSYEVRAALVSSDNIVPDGSYAAAVLTINPSSTVGNTSVSTEKDENGAAKIEVTEEDLEEIIDNIPENGQLGIDVSEVEDAETVVLPADLIQSLDGSDKVEQLNITSDSGSISMGGEVLSTMADAITGKDDTVALQMTSVEETELTEEQKEALDSISTGMDTVIVEVSLVVTHYDDSGSESGTTTIHQLGGNVEVTVQYPAEEVQGKYVIVCYLSDDGSVTYTRAKYDPATGTITFKTNHFSTFALMLNENPVVQVNNGTGDGIYAAGSTVTIKAPEKVGYDFLGWRIDHGEVSFVDPKADQISFTMPEGEVEVTAVYQIRPAEAVWNAAHTALTVRNGCEGAASVMVAFYDNVTGQMLTVRVLTAEEVLAGTVIDGGEAFVSCTAKVMFLTGRLIPVAEAVKPD